MKYINAEKLKAEIKRLEEMDYPCDTYEESVGFYYALDCIKSFIDSHQQEQPEVDLEKEIERIVENEERFMKFQVKEQLIKYVARHFYELGLNARKDD